LIRALEEQTITLYGDGKQVRDVLYVDDLVDAFLLARAEMPRIAGQAFNIGGGPDQAISLLELIEIIGRLHGHPPQYEFQDWRPGDQRYYVSDTRKFRNATGWSPKVHPHGGTKKLYRWLRDSGALLGQSRSEPARPRQAVVYRRASSRNGVSAAERH